VSEEIMLDVRSQWLAEFDSRLRRNYPV